MDGERSELECSVAFGVGVFNLFVSLLPPVIVKIVEWIGFSGDRHVGLVCVVWFYAVYLDSVDCKYFMLWC